MHVMHTHTYIHTYIYIIHIVYHYYRAHWAINDFNPSLVGN